MKLKKIIKLMSNILNHCPSCGSDNIANEGSAENEGLEITCHDCSHQWLDDDRVQQGKMFAELIGSGNKEEAELITEMSSAEYLEFLKENFDISSLNQ
jgi:DNA-directed RNA polymerase subunit RPC12/RpoP